MPNAPAPSAESEPIVVTADAIVERSPVVILAPEESTTESGPGERAGLDGSIVPLDSLPIRLVRPVLELATDAAEEDDLFAEPCAPDVWPGATRVMSDGEFAWRDLDPGTATFRLMLHGESEPLIVVPGIVQRAGETCRDPRVQEIPLGGHVLMHRLTVVGEGGESLPSALAVRAMPATGDCLAGFHANQSGEIVIASRSSTIAVRVFAPDHRVAELSEVGAYARVELRRGYEVKIRPEEGWQDVDRLGPWITPTTSVSVILEPRHPNARFLGENWTATVDMNHEDDALAEVRDTLATELSTAGGASFCLPESGRYRVMLGIDLRRTRDTESAEVPAEGAEAVELPDGFIIRLAAGEIDVLDASKSQSFQVRPDTQMLQAFLEHLDR